MTVPPRVLAVGLIRLLAPGHLGGPADLLPVPPRGVYASGNSYFPVLVTAGGLWHFQSIMLIQQHGWPEGNLRKPCPRQSWHLPFRGVIDSVDPPRFGPACCPRG